MCFTDDTCSDFSEPEVPAVPLALLLLDDEAAEFAVPVTFTSWPTCSLSLAVSPVS